MKIGIIDILYIIIIFQLSLFAVFLFIRRKKCPSNLMLGIQLLSQAFGILAGVLHSIYGYSNLPVSILIYTAGCSMFLWGPTFYLYIKEVSYKDYRFTAFQLIHFIPFLFFLLYAFCRYFFIDGPDSLVFSSIYPNIFVRLQVLLYIILSIKTLYSVRKNLMVNYSSISKTNWAWIRFLVIRFTVSFILTAPIIMYRYYIDKFDPFVEFGNMLPYFIYFNFIIFKAWYNPEIFMGMSENIKYKSSRLTREEAEKLVRQLNEYTECKKPHLNPEITLNQISDDLNVNTRILSQVINEYFNQNFYDYINKLRVEESKKILITDTKKTVLEILYEVGFNTKSAYNTAFKKATGLTPTEYRRQNIDAV